MVDVKPTRYLQEPKNKRAFVATAEACRKIGWEYGVQAEPNAVLGANVGWLAGFRRPPPQLHDYASTLLGATAAGPTTVDSLIRLFDEERTLARPVLFHLIWKGALTVELSSVALGSSKVRLKEGMQ